MRIIHKQGISYSEKKFNEDVVGFTKTCGFIIDGASGLTKTNVTNFENDVYWYVSQLKEMLNANLDSDKSLKEILKDSIKIIRNRFYSIANNYNINTLDFPSAAIAITRLRNNKIEYFILGDCSIVLKYVDGKTHYLKDDRVTKFDNQVIKNIIEENEKNTNQNKIFKGFSEKTLSMLRDNRLKKNTDSGYWILEFDQKAIDKGLYGNFPTTGLLGAILMSDGFSCAIDNYRLIESKSIFDYVKIYGLEKVYTSIRDIEKDDVDCRKYPRLKKSDDCSAIYMNVGK